jgi:DNA-directed RNA polymerase specialized sigma24 family protein
MGLTQAFSIFVYRNLNGCMSEKDRNMFDGLKSGDSSVIKEIIRIYRPYAQSYAHGNSGTREDGKDLLNNTLTELWRWLNKENTIVSATFDAIIKRFMRNIWLKEITRRKGMFEQASENMKADDVSNDCEDLCYQLFKSGRCKQIFELYFQGIPAAEAYKTLDMENVNTYNQAFFVCRNNLKKFIEENQMDPDCTCFNPGKK